MLFMFKCDVAGPPRIRRHMRQVREDIRWEESNPLITCTKEGMFELAYRTRIIPAKACLTCGQSSPETTVTEIAGPGRFIGVPEVYISPGLGDLKLSDFPDGFTFGGGAKASIQLTRISPTGQRYLWSESITWGIFPYGTKLTDSQWYRMREIFEGMPPGNPERHTFNHPFTAEGALEPQAARELLAQLSKQPRDTLKPYEVRWLDIELPKLIL